MSLEPLSSTLYTIGVCIFRLWVLVCHLFCEYIIKYLLNDKILISAFLQVAGVLWSS